MEPSTKILSLLDQIPQPVFLAADNTITYHNRAAQLHGIETGMSVSPLITIGQSEYRQFTEGRLLLMLTVDQVQYHTSVVKTEGYDLFCLEATFQDPSLRALALAAQKLRNPLSNAMLEIDALLSDILQEQDSPTLQNIEALNRNLYQMYRMISNMSDASVYGQRLSTRMEPQDIVSFMREVSEKAATLAANCGYQIQFHGMKGPVFCTIDTEKLERAVYNLVSNAMKHASSKGIIHISLQEKREKLYISVQNSAADSIAESCGDFFLRFLREPELENDNSGIGLGLMIVRGAAIAHNGTLLIHQPAGEGLKFTMSISLQKCGSTLRSPVTLPIDYNGGYDRALIELADMLPPDLYK